MLTDAQIEEMLSRVRKLELKARRLVRESFSGQYQSSFRGQGLDFDDFREYQHGDEVRFIDWNITARMNTPFVKKFREERELNVILSIDLSGSVDYGSVNFSKREIMAEIAAILGFSALYNGDKVGLHLFAENTLLFIPPEKGTRHLLRMIREILVTQSPKAGTSIDQACSFLVRTLPRKSLIFQISDFVCTESIEKSLGRLSSQHETLTICVQDPLEKQLPDLGTLTLLDPESGITRKINTSNSALREAYLQSTSAYEVELKRIFKKFAIDSVTISTQDDVFKSLHLLLKKHNRKGIR